MRISRAVSTSPAAAMAGSTRHEAQANSSTGSSSSSQRAMSKSWMVKSRKSPPLVGMKAGGGGAGSWLIRCSVSSAPISPLAIRAFSAPQCGSKRLLKATYSGCAGRSSSAAWARSRARSRSSGFSQNTALPAASAARTRSRWVLVEVETSTAAIAGSASTPSTLPTAQPSSAAIASATSAFGSTMLTRSRRGLAAAFMPCTWPMRPAPSNATFGAPLMRASSDGGLARTNSWVPARRRGGPHQGRGSEEAQRCTRSARRRSRRWPG